MSSKPSFKTDLIFVKKKHKGQYRAGKSPAWTHLLRVAQTLQILFEGTSEGTASERQLISVAALGHDLLEDTNASKKEIANIFTSEGLALIEGMTNEKGDSDHGDYIRQMKSAPEAVRLIKLSDLYDNYTSIVHNRNLLKERWIKSFFLPIVEPMFGTVRKTKFVKYKKTAALLIAMIALSAGQVGHSAASKKQR
jgi:(p)ppGpp synthase/HD superfamily hydrolase